MMSELKNQNQIQEDQPYNFENRPDIDGLRAICVIAVFIQHLPWAYRILDHGYLGIQVFFVISGYLITGVILRDMTRKRFTYLGFYERRIKRILPNIMLCILVNIYFTYYYTNFKDMCKLSWSALKSLFMIKNFYDIVLQGHFWSLSIQEQFYMVWPLTVFLIFKFSLLAKLVILSIVGGISLKLMANRTIYFDKSNQYATGYSIWNLLLGCSITFIQYEIQKYKEKKQIKYQKLASANNQVNQFTVNRTEEHLQIIEEQKQSENKNLCKRVTKYVTDLAIIFIRNLITSIAFFSLAYTIALGLSFHLHNDDKFWIYRVIAATCTAILIGFKGTLISYFLKWKVLVEIGKLSYSLYVWHYAYIMLNINFRLERKAAYYYLIFPLIACFFEEKVTNSKWKYTAHVIVLIYLIIVAEMWNINRKCP